MVVLLSRKLGPDNFLPFAAQRTTKYRPARTAVPVRGVALVALLAVQKSMKPVLQWVVLVILGNIVGLVPFVAAGVP